MKGLSMMNSMLGREDDSKQEAAVQASIASTAKKSKSKVAKAAAMSDNAEIEGVCQIVHMLVEEGLDMYENGTMTYAEMIDDLYEALKAVSYKGED